MVEPGLNGVRRRREKASRLPNTWVLIALALLALLAAGCYNSTSGETRVGGAINFKLPVFSQTGGNAVEIFTEMHYQPSFKVQEPPRILPPPDSVPVTGRELEYTSLEEYKTLTIPDGVAQAYDAARAQQLFTINCSVCHGPTLRGASEQEDSAKAKILQFMKTGPFPADLTAGPTVNASDGELFGFISGGGRQGLASSLRGLQSASPMPQFKFLLTEEERWTLVRFLRIH